VHDDGTGRLQTVSKDECPIYYQLIKDFYDITGVPVLLNTSFNDNEPIVETPVDALITFLSTDIDVLVLDDIFIDKQSFSQKLKSTIINNLKIKRSNSIKRKSKKIKKNNFINYSYKKNILFQKNESYQANWHLKYSAKYELEKFIDVEKKIHSKILLFGTQTHTKFLYEKIYDFPVLNILGFIDIKKSSKNLFKDKFKKLDFKNLKTIKFDKILITSHEYQFVIFNILKEKGISEDKIITIYDEASDSLERHIEYLPKYNNI